MCPYRGRRVAVRKACALAAQQLSVLVNTPVGTGALLQKPRKSRVAAVHAQSGPNGRRLGALTERERPRA